MGINLWIKTCKILIFTHNHSLYWNKIVILSSLEHFVIGYSVQSCFNLKKKNKHKVCKNKVQECSTPLQRWFWIICSDVAGAKNRKKKKKLCKEKKSCVFAFYDSAIIASYKYFLLLIVAWCLCRVVATNINECRVPIPKCDVIKFSFLYFSIFLTIVSRTWWKPHTHQILHESVHGTREFTA